MDTEEPFASPARATPRTRSAVVRLVVLASVLVAASITAYELGWLDLSHTLHHIQQLRRSENLAVFLIGFVAVYAVGTSVGLPGLPFNVTAGALFGTLIGGALAWLGSMLGAAAGYWIARTVGHNEVLRWVRRFRRVDAALAQATDFAGMLRLRLIPVLPLGTVNFVGGLARANFWSYLAATAIGIVPSVAIYSYFADSLLEGAAGGRRQALTSLLVASGLLILLSLAPRFLANQESSRRN